MWLNASTKQVQYIPITFILDTYQTKSFSTDNIIKGLIDSEKKAIDDIESCWLNYEQAAEALDKAWKIEENQEHELQRAASILEKLLKLRELYVQQFTGVTRQMPLPPPPSPSPSSSSYTGDGDFDADVPF